MTKTAIAATALRLAARGVVDLDAPLPGHAYSLRHLLSHTSGLGCYAAMSEYHADVAARRDAWSEDEVLARTGNGVAEVAPLVRWRYSNIGYLIARRHLTEATDLSLTKLLDTEILGPLGLRHTWVAEGREDLPHLPGGSDYDFGWVYHGCLIGPPGDAARTMEGLLDGPLLTPQDRAILTERRPLGGAIPGRPWTQIGYGLGLMSGTLGGFRAEGHSGNGPFSTCAVYRVGGRITAAFATAPSEALAERATLRVRRVAGPRGRARSVISSPRSAQT